MLEIPFEHAALLAEHGPDPLHVVLTLPGAFDAPLSPQPSMAQSPPSRDLLGNRIILDGVAIIVAELSRRSSSNCLPPNGIVRMVLGGPI